MTPYKICSTQFRTTGLRKSECEWERQKQFSLLYIYLAIKSWRSVRVEHPICYVRVTRKQLITLSKGRTIWLDVSRIYFNGSANSKFADHKHLFLILIGETKRIYIVAQVFNKLIRFLIIEVTLNRNRHVQNLDQYRKLWQKRKEDYTQQWVILFYKQRNLR